MSVPDPAMVSLTKNYNREIREAAEAICGALHRYSFEFLGESSDGASTWFHRGNRPKDVRIEVLRSALAPMVLVNIEWRNLAEHARGRITAQCDVRGSKADVFAATEKAVLRCLEIYRDVLDETGVAGRQPAFHPHQSTADSPEIEDDDG